MTEATGSSRTCAENGTPGSAGYNRVAQSGGKLQFASLNVSRFTVKRFRFRHVCNWRLAPTICRSGS